MSRRGPGRGECASAESTRSPLPEPRWGASWIFSRDDLERSRAFFATIMNDTDLPSNHGFLVRLVVPRWYGCACIKWVSRIDLVPDDEPATPIRVEQWAIDGHIDNRVVGLVWRIEADRCAHDPFHAIRTRRLDVCYYTRDVLVDEV